MDSKNSLKIYESRMTEFHSDKAHSVRGDIGKHQEIGPPYNFRTVKSAYANSSSSCNRHAAPLSLHPTNQP
jgi:hypothetical protein